MSQKGKDEDKAQKIQAATEVLTSRFNSLFDAAYKDLNDAQKTVDVLCMTLAAGLVEGDFEHDAEFMDKFDTLINYAANILADAEAKVEDLVKAVNDPESLLDILKEAAGGVREGA